MSLGKSGGTTVQTAELTPEQRQQIAAQTEFFTGTIAPSYKQAVTGATDVYNRNLGGVTYAGQNLAGTASQAQRALGETGESALRTGISGLQNLFSPEYEAQQMEAVLAPAQAQYQQNLAGLGAQFGGAGQIGSARQALAQTQLAGTAQQQQQTAAAQVARDIAGQRLAAGQGLAGLGQGGLGQAIGAAGQVVSAAQLPSDLYNKYASVIFGTPAASYSPDFRGTQGVTQNTTGYQAGIGGAYGSAPFRL
jgi:hypothetical protein